MARYIKKRILFSALGGSLFPTLKNYLENKFEIFFHDNNDRLKYEYPNYEFIKSPKVGSCDYIPFLKNYILSKKIDIYIPLIDEELLEVKKSLEGFMNLKVISPNTDFIKITLDKFCLMEKLKNEKISLIESFEFKASESIRNLNDYPYIIKPIFGRGSRGIKIVSNKNQLNYNLNNSNEGEFIQKFITGTEYTIGVNVNNLNQILSISSRKIIFKKGITIEAVTKKNNLINQTVKKIVKKLKPEGPFNLQLIVDSENNINVFEINPRFSTSLVLSYYSGIREIETYLEYYNKDFKEKFLESKDNLFLKRRWENVFYEI